MHNEVQLPIHSLINTVDDNLTWNGIVKKFISNVTTIIVNLWFPFLIHHKFELTNIIKPTISKAVNAFTNYWCNKILKKKYN